MAYVKTTTHTHTQHRSGLNAAMNARLSGQWGTLFPNMHIQCPARVLYINGFKVVHAHLHACMRVHVCYIRRQ